MNKRFKKRLFQLIYKLHGDKDITSEDFQCAYLGALAFIYVDTYGLPENLVWDTIERCMEDLIKNN